MALGCCIVQEITLLGMPRMYPPSRTAWTVSLHGASLEDSLRDCRRPRPWKAAAHGHRLRLPPDVQLGCERRWIVCPRCEGQLCCSRGLCLGEKTSSTSTDRTHSPRFKLNLFLPPALKILSLIVILGLIFRLLVPCFLDANGARLQQQGRARLFCFIQSLEPLRFSRLDFISCQLVHDKLALGGN